MPQPPAFGYEQVFTELVRGVVDTVTDKPGLSAERKAASQQTAVCSVMAFNPRDPVETMLAGQCVVYDHMLRDGARNMIRGQAEPMLIQARPGVLAAGKMFLGALSMLLRMQRRAQMELAFARPLPTQEEAPKPREAVPVAAAEEPPPAHPTRSAPDVTSVQPAARVSPTGSQAAPTPVSSAIQASSAIQVSSATQTSPALNRPVPAQSPAVPSQRPAPPVTPRNVPIAEPAMHDMTGPAAMEQIAAAAALLARDGR